VLCVDGASTAASSADLTWQASSLPTEVTFWLMISSHRSGAGD
jgi:hypothetical protein